MSKLATNGLRRVSLDGSIVTITGPTSDGCRTTLEVWQTVNVQGEQGYGLYLLNGDPDERRFYEGHPLYGILHDVREVDPDLWPILVDMLLDYTDTADAMRKILEDAAQGEP